MNDVGAHKLFNEAIITVAGWPGYGRDWEPWGIWRSQHYCGCQARWVKCEVGAYKIFHRAGANVVGLILDLRTNKKTEATFVLSVVWYETLDSFQYSMV